MPLTDVTAALRDACQQLPNDKVVKSPEFPLFQGTQALEINNAKLDSGIIPLSAEEENYDCDKPLSLQEVLTISDRLFRNFWLWLDNASLTYTVMSCSYVEKLLVQYSRDMHTVPEFGAKTDVLVNVVLKGVVMGVLGAVQWCLGLGSAGVVYEEEDINSQTMNLMIMFDTNGVASFIEKGVKALKSYDSQDAQILMLILQVLERFNKLPMLMHEPLKKQSVMDTSLLTSLRAECDILRQHVPYLNSLPDIPGCFSMGIQKRLDNRLPSRSLVPFTKEDYSSLSLLIDDFMTITQVSQRLTSKDLITHSINFANNNHHVIARAFYPLFLIRDDGTILGEERFNELMNEELLRFSCWDTEYINTSNDLIKQKVADMINHITLNFIEWLNIMNQNSCRQRQHMSRSIKTFDGLHVQVEAFEMNLIQVFQLNDQFEYQGEMVEALPITSWVYYMKLSVMLEVVLRGFELELYQTWEYHSMYWYSNYLLDNILVILDRVVQFNESKIKRINQMKNQLKKKKGDQKVRYKEKMHQRQAQIPNIQLFVASLNSDILKFKILRSVTQLQLHHLSRLQFSVKLIKEPEFSFVSLERLFKIRMKPFSSVGVPECPIYSHYQYSTNHTTLADVNVLKNEALTNIKTILNGIANKDITLGYGLSCKDWTHWYNLLQRSCVGITLEMGKSRGSVSVDTEGFHRYFPVVKVTS